MDKILGICGSSGYAAGTAVVKKTVKADLTPKTITDTAAEIKKLRDAQAVYDKKLTELYNETLKNYGEDSAEIFEAYRIILSDEAFFGKCIELVEKEKNNIEYVISQECGKVSAMFMALDDDYLKDRAVDIENVCGEIICIIQGIENDFAAQISGISDAVVIADDLTPAETVKMDKGRLKGFVTEKGGVTSHTAILAKVLGIPAIVGAVGVLGSIKTGDNVFVDAFKGEVYVNPSQDIQNELLALKADFDKKAVLYNSDIDKPAITKDGLKIDINVNAGDLDSLKTFSAETCDGVGLFRTEFLYMGSRDYPTEDEQFAVYKEIAEKAQGKEVIIRTLDIGGDKKLDYMALPEEENPFLGCRAIRLCFKYPKVFLTQLCAILKASAFGNIKIMFPMIVNLEELLKAKDFVRQAMEILDKRGEKYNPGIKMGIMVETPAAVLLSDQLAMNCDFFSIGSNDLIQYTTATDRMNESIQWIYDNCNISFLRAVRIVSQNAAKCGIPWGICGEVASDDRLTALWAVFGAAELSVVPSRVGYIKYLVRNIDRKLLRGKIDNLLSSVGSIEEVKKELGFILDEIRN